MTSTINYAYEPDALVEGENHVFANVNVTAGAVYARGDLLDIDAALVSTLAVDHTAWQAVAFYDVTAADSTAMAAAGTKMRVIVQSDGLSIEAVKLGGTVLAAGDYDAATARGIASKINLV